MMMEVDFVDSVRHGPYRQWYLSGSLESEGQYNNGKIDGKWTTWDANGKLLAITCYAGGEKQWTCLHDRIWNHFRRGWTEPGRYVAAFPRRHQYYGR